MVNKGREEEVAALGVLVNYYPAFLNISGKKVVVVGGGTIAEERSCIDEGRSRC